MARLDFVWLAQRRREGGRREGREGGVWKNFSGQTFNYCTININIFVACIGTERQIVRLSVCLAVNPWERLSWLYPHGAAKQLVQWCCGLQNSPCLQDASLEDLNKGIDGLRVWDMHPLTFELLLRQYLFPVLYTNFLIHWMTETQLLCRVNMLAWSYSEQLCSMATQT